MGYAYYMSTTLQYPRDALVEWLKSKRPLDPEAMKLLGELVDTLFFASLGREEGHLARVHIIYSPDGARGVEQTREAGPFNGVGPQPSWHVIPFEPRPLTAKALVKLTPAALLHRTAVIAGPHDNELHILGLARRINDCDGGNLLIFSAPEPGCVVLSSAGEELFRYEQGRFVPPADTVPLWNALTEDGLIKTALETSCSSLIEELASLNGSTLPTSEIFWPLKHLIETMVATGHGGLIAMLADDSTDARPVYQIPEQDRALLGRRLRAYLDARQRAWKALRQARTGNAAADVDGDMEDDMEDTLSDALADSEVEKAKRSLDSMIESVGYLTAMDNALLLGPDFAVLGAGYPVPVPGDEIPVVHHAKDLHGDKGAPYDLDQHGSRHRAAATFAHQNSGGLVFIVSQDGPLHCMLRPPGEDHVLVWKLRLPVI
jgi:hypothetical protein